MGAVDRMASMLRLEQQNPLKEDGEQLADTERYQILPQTQSLQGMEMKREGLAVGVEGGRDQVKHLRFRRTIIDECCKKPCSVNEMRRYCGMS